MLLLSRPFIRSVATVALLLLSQFSSATSRFDKRLIQTEAEQIISHQRQSVFKAVFSQDFEPIRIKAVFDKDSFSKAMHKNAVEKATEEALDFWRRNLKVRRVINANGIKMRLSNEDVNTGDDCSRLCFRLDFPVCFPVPRDGVFLEGGDSTDSKCGTSKENGYIADLLVFVSYGVGENGGWCKGTPTSKTVVAKSINLRLDDRELRPITGIIDFCKGSEEGISKSKLVDIIRHEFAHILAYSQNRFKLFRKPDNANSFYDLTTKKLIKDMDAQGLGQHFSAQPENSGVFSVYKKNYYLKTPIVQRTARVFFNCPTLNGAPLEFLDNSKDPVGDGRSFSHLDEDKLPDDLMSSIIGPMPTPLTFAVLEDSGWYKVNPDNLDVEKFRARHGKKGIEGLDAGCEAACGDHCGLEDQNFEYSTAVVTRSYGFLKAFSV